MRRTILPIFLLLALTACQERNTLPVPAPKLLSADEITAEQPKTAEKTDTLKVPAVTAPKVVKRVKKPVKVQTHTVTPTKTKQEIFSGGIMTDGLDLGTIRLGKEGSTTRLVLDSYKWNIDAKTPSIRSYETGYYTFTYNPETKRITGIVDGYRGFSALHGTKERSFGANKVVKRLYLEKYLDDSGYKFSIDLKQDAKVNVFDLKRPGRIIIDITPR